VAASSVSWVGTHDRERDGAGPHGVDEHWYVTIGQQDIETSREGRKADLTAAGTAADLNLFLGNRTPDSDVTLTGDTDLMDIWRTDHRVQWLGAWSPRVGGDRAHTSTLMAEYN
jgi:hypothetical protein